MWHRLVRLTCVALSVGVFTIGATRALEAECFPEPWNEGHEVCQVCDTEPYLHCCYSHWIDDVLESSWCDPVLPEP